jgi:hypothetical protein
VDLVLIALYGHVESVRLRHALEATFTAHNTHPLPTRFPPASREWEGPYRRLAAEVEIASNIEDAYRIAEAMLDPVLADDFRAGIWSASEGRWGT